MSKFVPQCSFICDIYKLAQNNIDTVINQEHVLWGNIKNVRDQTQLYFVTIYDGTHITPFQLILDLEKHPEFAELKSQLYAGSYVKVSGVIVKSPAKGQLVEMLVDKFIIEGPVRDNTSYLPLVKSVNLDTLRGKNAYLRPKFQTYQAVYTIVDKVDEFINKFLRNLDFKRIDPNILTVSDCEGAGEMFVVSTLMKDHIKDIPNTDGIIDYSKDFFGKKVGLTVSSQLQLEALSPMGKGVYTINKSFRAEKSLTSRHIAEFTHLEVESRLIRTVDDLMNFEEDLLVYIIKNTLTMCSEELKCLNNFISKGIIARLESFIKEDFARISYTDAVDIAIRDKTKIKELYGLDEEIYWGMDLGSKIERYLCEHVFKKPTFVFNYPKDLKSFYMKQNPIIDPEKQTVSAVDLLMPYCGEICGGSIRESDYDKLIAEMERRHMKVDTLSWYVDLRKNGSMLTGGFGAGVQRIIQSLCYMNSNIRDVVPFPVAYTELDF